LLDSLLIKRNAEKKNQGGFERRPTLRSLDARSLRPRPAGARDPFNSGRVKMPSTSTQMLRICRG